MVLETSEYLIYIFPGTIVLACLLFTLPRRTKNGNIILSRMNSQQHPESPNELSTIQSHSSSIPPSQTNESNSRNMELDPSHLISRYQRNVSEAVTIAPVHLPSSSQALPNASNSSYFDPPPPYPGFNTSSWIKLRKFCNILCSLDINVYRLLLLEFRLSLSKMAIKFIPKIDK